MAINMEGLNFNDYEQVASEVGLTIDELRNFWAILGIGIGAEKERSDPNSRLCRALKAFKGGKGNELINAMVENDDFVLATIDFITKISAHQYGSGDSTAQKWDKLPLEKKVASTKHVLKIVQKTIWPK